MPTTYFSLTVLGFSLVWEGHGVFVKIGKVERYWPSVQRTKA